MQLLSTLTVWQSFRSHRNGWQRDAGLSARVLADRGFRWASSLKLVLTHAKQTVVVRSPSAMPPLENSPEPNVPARNRGALNVPSPSGSKRSKQFDAETVRRSASVVLLVVQVTFVGR